MARRQGVTPEAAAPAKAASVKAPTPTKSAKKIFKPGKKVAPKVRDAGEKAKKEAEKIAKMKNMSASEFEKLSTLRGGKPESKLFDSSKPAAKAKPDKPAAAGFTMRQQKINRLVSKKLRLLAKCKGGPEEKVQVTFTVALTGKVTSVRIKGTFNDQKKSCVASVFWRSVFPKGDDSLTLRKTIRL